MDQLVGEPRAYTGVNVLQVYGQDKAGNLSPTNTIRFTYVVLVPVSVQINPPGWGTVRPAYDGKLLQIGKRYPITAKANQGFVFTSWTGGVTGTTANITFVVQSNLAATANFTTRPACVITYPAAKHSVSDTWIACSGKTKDNVDVASIYWSFNNGDWTQAYSSDNGTNWETDFLALAPGRNTIQAFAVDVLGSVSRTNRIEFNYVGNWIQTSAPAREWTAIASSADGTKLVATAYDSGIYTSTNSGLTWTQTSAPVSGWGHVASSANGTKLAAMRFNGGIYTSTNSGFTWAQTSAPNAHWYSLTASADGTKLAAIWITGYEYMNGIYTSSDSGLTWIPVTAPVAVSLDAIASSADGTKLALVGGGQIYISKDSGITWTQTSAPSLPWGSVVSSADGSRLAAGHDDTSGVSVGQGIYISDDSGATWRQTSAPVSGYLACSAHGTRLAVAGGTVYTSGNSGLTWTRNGAPDISWGSIALSADGTRLVAVGAGGIWAARVTFTSR